MKTESKTTSLWFFALDKGLILHLTESKRSIALNKNNQFDVMCFLLIIFIIWKAYVVNFGLYRESKELYFLKQQSTPCRKETIYTNLCHMSAHWCWPNYINRVVISTLISVTYYCRVIFLVLGGGRKLSEKFDVNFLFILSI